MKILHFKLFLFRKIPIRSMSFNIFLQDLKPKKKQEKPNIKEPTQVKEVTKNVIISKDAISVKEEILSHYQSIIFLKNEFQKELSKISTEKSMTEVNEEMIDLLKDKKIQILKEIQELEKQLQEKKKVLQEIEGELKESQYSKNNGSQKRMDDLYIQEQTLLTKVQKCNYLLDLIESSRKETDTSELSMNLKSIENTMKFFTISSKQEESKKEEKVERKETIKIDEKIEAPKSPRKEIKEKPIQEKPVNTRANATPSWMENIKKVDRFGVIDSTPIVIVKKKEIIPVTDPKLIDPSKCTFIGNTFTGPLKKELSFMLTANNCKNEKKEIKENSFGFQLLDGPENYMPNMKVNTKDMPFGSIQVTFQAEQPGDYQLGISVNDVDIQGSPFKISIENLIEERKEFELSEICHYVACFNPIKKEILIKTNAISNSVLCFDQEFHHTHNFDLKLPAWSLFIDSKGNYYFGDNKKSFFKTDSNMNVLWTYTSESKFALGICTDEEFVYAIYHKGPMIKLDIETGKLLETIQLSTNLTFAFNIICYKDLLYVGDKKDILVFDKKGKVQKTLNGHENVAFITMENHLYVCDNKQKKWEKLEI